MIVILLLLAYSARSGPAYIACEVACSEFCWPLIAVPPPIVTYMACMVPCTAGCAAFSRFSKDTSFATSEENGLIAIKSIE